MHVFISYAKKDTKDFATRLCNALVELPDVTAWMDTSLEAADSWASQIQAEIECCNYVVVLLSPDINRPPTGTGGRSFVLKEISFAQSRQKIIIPVMVKSTSLPLQLADVQYIDVSCDSLQNGVNRVVDNFARHAGIQNTSDKLTQPISEAIQKLRQIIGNLEEELFSNVSYSYSEFQLRRLGIQREQDLLHRQHMISCCVRPFLLSVILVILFLSIRILGIQVPILTATIVFLGVAFLLLYKVWKLRRIGYIGLFPSVPLLEVPAIQSYKGRLKAIVHDQHSIKVVVENREFLLNGRFDLNGIREVMTKLEEKSVTVYFANHEGRDQLLSIDLAED